MSRLTLAQVWKNFGSNPVIHPLDITVEDGEFVVFVGPSGCGKSTLLRIIAGLEGASGGEILIDGQPVTHLPPVSRNVAMVFQNYALYPHMTVEENIGFGLKIAGLGKVERAEKVTRAAEVLHLGPYLKRRPKELSGGQRQRVAIGRAIVKQPGIFLFDEPLSNLDPDLRSQVRLEIGKLHETLKATMIYVTHDQVEAMTLADKIVVLRDGRVEQVGRPLDVYEDPVNAFVAGFIGSPRINLVDGEIQRSGQGGAMVRLPTLGQVDILVDGITEAVAAGVSVQLGFRPEHARLTSPGSGIAATVEHLDQLGSVAYAHLATAGGARFTVEVRPGVRLKAGDGVNVAIDSDKAMLFHPAGARIK